MNEEQLIQAKIKLADAIIAEAEFHDIEIDLENDEIEHQLGTVWVGDATISIQAGDDDDFNFGDDDDDDD